jgi:hypothetical protein
VLFVCFLACHVTVADVCAESEIRCWCSLSSTQIKTRYSDEIIVGHIAM